MYILRYQRLTILNKLWTFDKTSKRSVVDVVYDIHEPSSSPNGKHILVLHGLLGFKKNWRNLCKKIASTTKASVIAADARNHGDSPHNNSHTYLDLASDASQLLAKLSVSKAHVIGHSMGGRTGMVLALSEPSKVASLIVIDISPVPRKIGTLTDFFPKLIDILKTVNFQESTDVYKAKDIAAKTIIASGASNMKGMEFILMNIGELPDKSFGWKCNLDALKANFKNIASFPTEVAGKKYTGPTLFIGGGQSDFLPKSDETVIKQYFPQAELKYIDHVGHNPHSEDQNAFFNIVDEFYSKYL